MQDQLEGLGSEEPWTPPGHLRQPIHESVATEFVARHWQSMQTAKKTDLARGAAAVKVVNRFLPPPTRHAHQVHQTHA